MKINASVDGVPVSKLEAREVILYLLKHRKEFKTDVEVRIAFDTFIRSIRGGKEN